MLFNVLEVFVVITSLVTNIVDSSLCDTKSVDNIYTKLLFEVKTEMYSEIIIVSGNQQYVWNTRTNTLGVPVQREAETLTKVHILDHLHYDCNATDQYCKELEKVHDLSLIITFSFIGGKYVYELTHGSISQQTEIILEEWELPFHQSPKGDPTKPSRFNLWPNGWVKQPNPCVAYRLSNHELIYVKRSQNVSDVIEVHSIKVFPENYGKNGTNGTEPMVESKVTELNIGVKFVGLFNYFKGKEDRIYAITKDMKIYEFTESQTFTQTSLKLIKMIGCSEEKPNHMIFIIITIVFIIVVVVFIVGIVCLVAYLKVYVPITSTNSKGSDIKMSSITKRSAQNSEVATIQTVDSITGKPIHH